MVHTQRLFNGIRKPTICLVAHRSSHSLWTGLLLWIVTGVHSFSRNNVCPQRVDRNVDISIPPFFNSETNGCCGRKDSRARVVLWSTREESETAPENSASALSMSSNDAADSALAASIIHDRKFLERNQHWIVFVDDEEAIRQSVGDFLYDSGYQITACSDANAVVEVCQAAATTTATTTNGMLPKIPSCIVSDIRMPGGPDGLELLQWIRASATFQRVPVILLTAKGLTEDRIAGYKAGADVYLPKPFYPQELLSSIDNVIQRRKEMKGSGGALIDLQQEMANLKLLLQQNSQRTVQQTDVYLTPASREILDLLCRGYTNAEIAEERGTSKHYVQKALKKIYQETGTSTRTELLKWAIQTGYVSPRLQ
jgi:DNA-binding NarL/FixJ family response regulator